MIIRLFYLLCFLSLSKHVIAQTITDYDGNVYPVVTIGTQKWMAMNLRATHFSDGSPITNAGYNNWYYFPLYEPRYSEPLIPPNTIDTLALGLWYNYPAAGDTRNVCPKGWHVATDADWFKLIRFLDPNSDTSTTMESAVAGGLLKDTALWVAPNTGATNSTSFSAIPVSDISGSILWPAGHVCCQGLNASFWCGGPPWSPGQLCLYRYLWYWQASVDRNNDDYSNGKSIRCVCDTLVTTLVNDIDADYHLRIYPIPSTDRISVSLDSRILGRINILNGIGQLVYTTLANVSSKELDISFLSKGIYIMILPDNNRSLRFVKD